MGAVMQTVNVSLIPEDIAYMMNDTGATTVLFNADFLPLMEKLRDHLKAVKTYVLMHYRPEPPQTDFPINCEYEALLSLGSPYFPFPDFDENAWATVFHTTGTTGRPKGVTFSHRQLVLQSLAGLVEYGLTPSQGRFHSDDVYMPMTPMFHVHAWGVPYTSTLSGCKLVFPGRYAPEMFVKLIETEKVTFTHCVPTILQMLLTAPGIENVDLSGLKMIVGGSALPPALARAALARGIDVFGGYGMSESCPGLTGTHLKSQHLGRDFEEEVRYRTSAGRALPMVDLRVVDVNMADVPHDGEAVGEIVVRTPWLTTGYLNNPEASEVLWGGGYLHTGDVASIDADGYIRISDRLKDIVKSGGEWIPHRSHSRTSSWRKRASSARRSSPSRTSSGANGRWRWSCLNPTTSARSARTTSGSRRLLCRAGPHLEDRDPRECQIHRRSSADVDRKGRQEEVASGLFVRTYAIGGARERNGATERVEAFMT